MNTMIFHPLHTDLAIPGRLNNPFYYQPCQLSLLAVREIQASIPDLHLNEGKMFGCLIVEYQGEIGYLKGFSGQINEQEDIEGYVPAVFDYLQPDGYFKVHEAEISAINHRIKEIESSAEYQQLKSDFNLLQSESQQMIAEKQKAMKEAKALRDWRRAEGNLSDEELAAMTRQSQYLKAEVHRTKVTYKEKLEQYRQQLEEFRLQIFDLKQKRKLMSDALQNWLFSQFVFRNGKGEDKSLLNIFREYWIANRSHIQTDGELVPPSGAGECCEPKLLQYALLHGMKPLAMAMFWWGPSPRTEIRHHAHFYPACNGKCKPILTWMLQGIEVEDNPLDQEHQQSLEIVYEDADIIVVNKPSGMLSVPGKSSRESVLSIIQAKYPDATGPMIVHRLDMSTSGLLVIARNLESYIHLQQQFAHHSISKRYVAIICPHGEISDEGKITLPLSPDIMDRPRQKVDYEKGKEAITTYRVLERRDNGEILIALYPHTGRTHQLRVHCAFSEGLNAPIKGDELYGKSSDRLYLHAEYLEFTHPKTLQRLRFTRKT